MHGAIRSADHGEGYKHLGLVVGVLLPSSGDRGARVILLAGEPLNEPIAAYGPFVMNTQREIMDAIESFQRGDFGKME